MIYYIPLQSQAIRLNGTELPVPFKIEKEKYFQSNSLVLEPGQKFNSKVAHPIGAFELDRWYGFKEGEYIILVERINVTVIESEDQF